MHCKRHAVDRENNSTQGTTTTNNNNNTATNTTRLELIHGLNVNEVGARLRDASDELGRNKRVLAFFLFDIDERRLAQLSGHGSTAHFAAAPPATTSPPATS